MDAGNDPTAIPIAGIDFSSAPSARKPIVVAHGSLWPGEAATEGAAATAATGEVGLVPLPGRLRIASLEPLTTLAAFDAWLAADATWVAGCDFPFGLPRAFLAAQGWCGPADDWAGTITRTAALSRAELVARCRAFVADRPYGDRFAHRATDRPAGSSPSMKWVNPPVVLMLHAGAPRLRAAGVHLPGLRAGDPRRVALEAYPGLLARVLAGRRSYKSDDPRRDDDARRAVRALILDALATGTATAIRVDWAPGLRQACLADFRGDALDAVLCAVQAAWGALRRRAGWGLPAAVDPLEGWIVGAGMIGATAVDRVPAGLAE